jgi:hypothetical protein
MVNTTHPDHRLARLRHVWDMLLPATASSTILEYDLIRCSTANIIVSGTVLFQFVVIVIEETFCIDAFMYASYWLFTYSFLSDALAFYLA